MTVCDAITSRRPATGLSRNTPVRVGTGAVGWSAAQWGGIGAIVCGLDCLFVAFRTGEQTALRTILVNVFACFMRVGVFVAQGSKDWGGELVHKEFLQGGFITTVFTIVGLYNLNGNMKAVKNVIKVPSMSDLTHAGLLVQFTLFFFYIMMFIWTDFPGANYQCPAGDCRKEAGLYGMMAWTVTMWTQVTLQILAIMQTASNAEKMEFAKMRALTEDDLTAIAGHILLQPAVVALVFFV